MISSYPHNYLIIKLRFLILSIILLIIVSNFSHYFANYKKLELIIKNIQIILLLIPQFSALVLLILIHTY